MTRSAYCRCDARPVDRVWWRWNQLVLLVVYGQAWDRDRAIERWRPLGRCLDCGRLRAITLGRN
jgi:hypothetical protein